MSKVKIQKIFCHLNFEIDLAFELGHLMLWIQISE